MEAPQAALDDESSVGRPGRVSFRYCLDGGSVRSEAEPDVAVGVDGHAAAEADPDVAVGVDREAAADPDGQLAGGVDPDVARVVVVVSPRAGGLGPVVAASLQVGTAVAVVLSCHGGSLREGWLPS